MKDAISYTLIVVATVMFVVVVGERKEKSKKLDCYGVDCPDVSCENPTYPKGDCCGECIARRGAKCEYGETKYKSGDKFKSLDACSKCYCLDGLVTCTFMGCGFEWGLE